MSNKKSNPFHDEDDDEDQNPMRVFGPFRKKQDTPGGLDDTRKSLGKMIQIPIEIALLIVLLVVVFKFFVWFFSIVF